MCLGSGRRRKSVDQIRARSLRLQGCGHPMFVPCCAKQKCFFLPTSKSETTDRWQISNDTNDIKWNRIVIESIETWMTGMTGATWRRIHVSGFIAPGGAQNGISEWCTNRMPTVEQCRAMSSKLKKHEETMWQHWTELRVENNGTCITFAWQSHCYSKRLSRTSLQKTSESI